MLMVLIIASTPSVGNNLQLSQKNILNVVMSIEINKLAPIVLFVYNRPDHTLKTLNSLRNNKLADQSCLYIYCDGPKDDNTHEELEGLAKTREIVKSEKWCKQVHVIENERNLGLANSVVFGVGEVLKNNESVIVLEDDLVLSLGFLEYMNKALAMYIDEENVGSVSGYFFPISKDLDDTFFLEIITTWGWGTWKRSWKDYEHNLENLKDIILNKNDLKRFNVDGSYNYYSQFLKNLNGSSDTWGIRWYMINFKLRRLTLYPNETLVANIGHDGSGENCNDEGLFNSSKLAKSILVQKKLVKEDLNSRNELINYFNEISNLNKEKISLFKVVINLLKRLYHKLMML